jgi:hypothetical protein
LFGCKGSGTWPALSFVPGEKRGRGGYGTREDTTKRKETIVVENSPIVRGNLHWRLLGESELYEKEQIGRVAEYDNDNAT